MHVSIVMCVTSPLRQGTWQFLSAVLLLYPGKFPHEVWHDLESFIHVLHWCCLRFHETEFSDDIDELQTHIYSLYDFHSTKCGISTGGAQKLHVLLGGSIPFDL